MKTDISPEAQARLNDRTWRFTNSRWRLWIYLSFGFLGLVGWIKIALKSRDRSLIYAAYVFTSLTILAYTFMGVTDDGNSDATTAGEDNAAGFFIVMWFVQIVASFPLNKRWLLWKAQVGDQTWVEENVSSVAPDSKSKRIENNVANSFLDVSNGDYVQTQQSFAPIQSDLSVQPNLKSAPKSIDLNNFSDEDKNILNQKVEGLVEKVTQEILENGHFLSFQDFSSRINLQPHEIAKLQTILTFSQKENPAPKNNGRILDI